MHGSGLVTFLSVLGTVLAGVGAVLVVLYTRARNSRDDFKAEVIAREVLKAAVDAAQTLAQAASASVAALRSEVTGLVAGVRSEVTGLRSEVTAVESRTALLESKMEVFWRNVAFDVSKILHSPHPGWGDLDTLLEKFRDQAIDSGEMAALEDHLRAIVDGRWEPSEVSRADQVAASLLLRAIEQTRV